MNLTSQLSQNTNLKKEKNNLISLLNCSQSQGNETHGCHMCPVIKNTVVFLKI